MKFEVIKEYCGIEKGKTVKCNKPVTIRHMIKEGYWKEIVKPIAKIEPSVEKRSKKIEPELKKRKKK